MQELTPKVTGIGGVFFFSDDVKQTRDWYAKHLGLDIKRLGFMQFRITKYSGSGKNQLYTVVPV